MKKSTFRSDTNYKIIKEIIKHYGFKNIFFCPYIINTKAKEKFNYLYKFAEENGRRFEMLYGIEIEKDYSISEEIDSDFWMPDEKEALKAMSIKYFEKYFAGNGYLYMDFTTENPQRSTPFGFKNGGLAIVLYSNCPNNSLPIIWSNDGGWVPLFLRHERYIKRIKK